jgi:glucose/arabinose dehydrogenase
MTFDPMTGTLWDTENGPSSMDEVNVVPAAYNSGWNQIMGPDALDPQNTSDLFNMPGAGLTYSDPEFSWQTTIAPTGILFPVGTTWGPSYDTVALVGDNNNGNIYRFPLNASRTAFDLSAFPPLTDLVADDQTEANLVRIGQGFGGITDFKIGPDNNVYVVNIFGTIYKISGPVPVALQGFTVE